MATGQLGGKIGPFRDPTSGQMVQGQVLGTFEYQAQGDPDAVLPILRDALVLAIREVIRQKLASNQVAIPTIPGSVPYYTQEIIAACNAARFGAQVTQLQLNVTVENPYAAAPQPMGQLPPDPITATKNAFAQAAKDQLDPRNYEYQARVNVGGFKLKASTDGGLDTEGLKNQVKDKVKTEIIWYGIGCVILLIVGVGLLGLGWYAYAQYQAGSSGGTAASGGKAAKWDGKTPFSCGGNDKLTLDGVTAKIASATAITASANCKLTLSNVKVTAPVGIEASGNAVVTVKGGSVTGSTAAAKVSGNGRIVFSGTSVSGKKDITAPGKITGP
jgi:hypothetical protein